MRRLTRIILLGIIAVSAAPAYAAQGSTRCVGPGSASALNQYCEDIPSAGGGTTPGAAGTSSVGTTLASQISRRFQTMGATDPHRQLLHIPTGSHRRHGSRHVDAPTSGHGTTNGNVTTSAGSLGLGLILALTLSAVAIAALAFGRRRGISNQSSDVGKDIG